jgi:hypothetical protein
MAKRPLTLDEVWALQEGQGHDERGRDLDVIVPAKDPEFGPYADHRFAPSGGKPPAGWRRLTEEEIHQASEIDEEEPD